MVRQFKISIAQLLCLTAIAGSIFHLATYDRKDPFWRDGALTYVQPNVPRHFELVARRPIAHPDPKHGATITYTDSSDLFLKNHRAGWERIRRLFYNGHRWRDEIDSFDFYDDYDYSKLNFRNSEDLLQLAQWEGRTDCRQQLHQLLQRTSEAELRGQIAYSLYWATVLPLLVLATAILVLAIYCPLRC